MFMRLVCRSPHGERGLKSEVGNGADVLMKIDMVGSDLLRAQGMCGASSGSIPTDVGQPPLRVQDMIVGGKEGGSANE